MADQEFTVQMTDVQYAKFREQAAQHYLNMEVNAIKQAEAAQKAVDQTVRAVDAQVAANANAMSRRDMFAQSALNGLLASGTYTNTGDGFEGFISQAAYNLADAMLKASMAQEPTP